MILALLRVITLAAVTYDDVTYTACPPLIWSFLEPAIGVTVACGPLMAPLLRENRFIKSLSNKSSGRGDSNFERMKEPAHQLAELPPRKATASTASGDPIIDISLPPERRVGDSDDTDEGSKYV
jgi:hypothetical protein